MEQQTRLPHFEVADYLITKSAQTLKLFGVKKPEHDVIGLRCNVG